MAIKVAVIGAGAAGLASARRLKENPIFSFVVYEQTDSVGGTWVYDERTGSDEYGLPIHTSMYKSLRTNLPKEVMGYPDFPITKPTERSYIPAADVLAFLKEFSEAFDLYQFIKFRHHVKKVSPKEDGNGWTVTVENLIERYSEEVDFDAVMICNGHYEVPNLPEIPGQELFSGIQMHSHDYRVPQFFKGMTVVVLGAGPSGLDIGLDLTSCAKRVYLSHHSSDQIDTRFPDNFTFKPDVKEIKSKEVIFVDGTSVEADCILYCTGYLYKFPFLAEDCGVKVRDNYVHPLYKHVIAIECPTLAFIGLPFYVCAFSMFDLQHFQAVHLSKDPEKDDRFCTMERYVGSNSLMSRPNVPDLCKLCQQVTSKVSAQTADRQHPQQTDDPQSVDARFFLASLSGAFKLPTKEDMLKDEILEMTKRKERGFSWRDCHKMGPLQQEYYDDLSDTAKIQGLPPVLTKLHNESSRRFLEDLINFRKDNYIILDESNFQEIK